MTRFVTMTLTIVFAHALAFGQGGYIGIFADPQGKDCYPRDVAPGVLQFYVVHLDTEGSAGAEFIVRSGGGFVGTYLGEQLGLPTALAFGNSNTGKAVGYGDCYAAPIHILTISYYCDGLSPPCSFFEVVGLTEDVSTVDCSLALAAATGGKTFVNSDGTCVCEAPGLPTPNDEATWGRIKSIYR